MARFNSYLKAMKDDRGELRLPLSGFNPMSREHVASLLDDLIAMDAEAVAEVVIHASTARLRGIDSLAAAPSYRFGLVVSDDARGGWTNRYFFEARHRFENKHEVEHGFITSLLWSSEPPTTGKIAYDTAAAIFRTAWIWTYGLPTTLGEMMRQEGMALRFAGGAQEADVDKRAVNLIRVHQQSASYPVLMACLYGDQAAVTLGYAPIGMPGHGGLSLAASRSFLGGEDPIDALRQI